MGQFDKFTKKEPTGAVKKEKIRQDKRKVKSELNEKLKDKKRKPFNNDGTNTKSSPPKRSKSQPIGESQTDKRTQKVAPVKKNRPTSTKQPLEKNGTDSMPLNKYIAHGGLCSRRDAAIWVKELRVRVNNIVVTEPGFKVQPEDKVTVDDKLVIPKRELVYVLLNKPKDFITTMEDDRGRKTVMDLVKQASTERLYPVGRLDRNTTGVLLLTNDGDLAQQLTHPSFEVRKIYEVKLDKVVAKSDLEQMLKGIELEDGIVHADAAGYADPKDKSVVGVEIHSGRNRVVRRMFEHLGYDVKNLDRVMFANLTKKNVERGKWRLLDEKEVRLLKYFNKSKHKTTGKISEAISQETTTPALGIRQRSQSVARKKTPVATTNKSVKSFANSPKKSGTKSNFQRKK